MSKRRTRQADPTPYEVAAIRRELQRFFDATDDQGRQPGNARCGVYVFYDYDGEPIYVGQTREQLRTRIRRHLTNQRTDAVAMNVLDPFEVLEVEIFPLYDLEVPYHDEDSQVHQARVKDTLGRAEYAVYRQVLTASSIGAVLNEAEIPQQDTIELPPSFRGRIVPDDVYTLRRHPDVRLARRAVTVANLARVISERQVSSGLRRTLLTQARRLELLARTRLRDFDSFPEEGPGEETGETSTRG